jgi:putative zinc finger/helix-turn-helix YgiT family protein
MSIRCINCGQTDLQSATVNLPGTVRGESYTAKMPGLACPNCGFQTIKGTEMAEFGRLLADQYRAKHGLLTSEQIWSRRTRLGMTQDAFARYLGVGVASVKRWEMGKIQDQRNNDLILQGTSETFSNTQAFAVKVGNPSSTLASYAQSATVMNNTPIEPKSKPSRVLLVFHRNDTVATHQCDFQSPKSSGDASLISSYQGFLPWIASQSSH